MRKVHFVQADVFSDSPFGGNPVVVVPDPGPMTPDEMQGLARGMNFAETAFVVPPTEPAAAFALRGYTPTTEVAYSGHQLLGAAHVLAQRGQLPLGDDPTEIAVQMGGELRPVVLSASDGGVARVSTVVRPAEFLETVADYGLVAGALSIEPMAIMQTGLPVQLVRTGLTCLIVPTRDLRTVRDLLPVGQAIDELLQDLGGDCLLAFAQETLSPANDVHVRVFAPPLGIEEDPATGAANGALMAYLLRHGEILARPTANLRSEQGHEMGRPSVIELEADTSTDPTRVLVGGRVSHSLEGSAFY